MLASTDAPNAVTRRPGGFLSGQTAHPDDKRGRKAHRIRAIPTQHRIKLDDTDSAHSLDLGDQAFPLRILEGWTIGLRHDRHRAAILAVPRLVIETDALVGARPAVAISGVKLVICW